MKYVLLFCGDSKAQQAFETMPAEDLAKQYEAVGRWFAEHGAKILSTQQLQAPQMATCVRFDAEGHPLITDGPFIEGNEVIGGYATIEVPDLDAALHMAKTWPARGTVEIRPVLDHSQP
jgi:hypothetical protein